MISSYQDLTVWQESIVFVSEVYAITKSFPKEEMYGLISQLRRAAVSVPSNIAEGQGRKTPLAFINHLNIAYGSLMEVETQLHIATKLKYVSEEQLDGLLKRSQAIGKMLNGLISSLSKNVTPRLRTDN